MNLQMNISNADGYSSNSQKIRVITENWVEENLYCPCCGNTYVRQFENNRPVADFYCADCREEYELKSKNGTIANKITDGFYDTMVNRIYSINNPNFLFMHYDIKDIKVKNLIIVPKHFFVINMIEKRKPLSSTAKRAGWGGCNILIKDIPEEGKIFLVKN